MWIDATGTVADRAASTVPRTVTTTASAPASPAPTESAFAVSVRARITERASTVLACLGTDAAAIEARWEPGQRVTMAVRGDVDAALAACVSSAIGPITAPPTVAAGTLVHGVARP